MFSFFGKKRASPVEDETPPIPGPRPDDGFVVVEPAPPGGGLYPSMGGSPYTRRPAPAPPLPSSSVRIDQTFHYLQGVPFSLSRDLQLSLRKDVYVVEIGDVLTFLMNKQRINNYDYDFSLEKSVLKEC
ncbi:uncharacterized protein LOC121733360 [Aricia agestis]|uniref:uncharacterized protein LOC121733360 n=1 Tax=Aricia agestis TaxID=91739 RepID=UPI001C20AB42|nr:uncharacterized protein LOC121733360 [Aricia agestis]